MAKNPRPSILHINNWRLWIWKTNALLNLIYHKPDIDKIYLYAKDPNEAKYQLLINKQESKGLKYLNDSEPVIEYGAQQ